MKVPPGGHLSYIISGEDGITSPCRVKFIVFNHDEHPVHVSRHYDFSDTVAAIRFIYTTFPEATEFVEEQP